MCVCVCGCRAHTQRTLCTAPRTSEARAASNKPFPEIAPAPPCSGCPPRPLPVSARLCNCTWSGRTQRSSLRRAELLASRFPGRAHDALRSVVAQPASPAPFEVPGARCQARRQEGRRRVASRVAGLHLGSPLPPRRFRSLQSSMLGGRGRETLGSTCVRAYECAYMPRKGTSSTAARSTRLCLGCAWWQFVDGGARQKAEQAYFDGCSRFGDRGREAAVLVGVLAGVLDSWVAERGYAGVPARKMAAQHPSMNSENPERVRARERSAREVQVSLPENRLWRRFPRRRGRASCGTMNQHAGTGRCESASGGLRISPAIPRNFVWDGGAPLRST